MLDRARPAGDLSQHHGRFYGGKTDKMHTQLDGGVAWTHKGDQETKAMHRRALANNAIYFLIYAIWPPESKKYVGTNRPGWGHLESHVT